MKSIHRQTRGSNLVTAFTLSSPNSQRQIDILQGLEIQPFIFALSGGIAELHLFLEDAPIHRDKKYENAKTASNNLHRTLTACGYGSSGIPYWARPGGPNLIEMRDLTEQARNCIPALNMRRLDLEEQIKCVDPSYALKITHQKTLFEERYDSFIQGYTGIARLADRIECDSWRKSQSDRQSFFFLSPVA